MEDQLWKEISMGISRKQRPPFAGPEIVLEIVQNQYQVCLNPTLKIRRKIPGLEIEN